MKGAGFDPAYIPGLTAPAPAEPADARPQEAGEPPAAKDVAPENEVPENEVPENEVPEDEAPEDAAPRDAEPAEEPEPEAEPPADGPVFEASDRRAGIVADHRGIRLSLDDQQCEFRWDEIGAVETATPRFGKRFTVTVHTPDRRWYPIEVDAPARARFAEWEKQLDAVLDAYFEDGAAGEDAAEEPPAEDS